MAASGPTPCPGNPGCRCAYCHGLAEFMLLETGNDYGLPATYVPFTAPERAPEPAVIQFRPRQRVRQPWDVRPARRRAA